MPTSGPSESLTSSRRKPSPRTIVAASVVALIVLFGVFNSQTVTIHWIVTTTQTPLIVVIVVCGLLGFAAGWLLSRRSAHRKAH